MSCTHSVLATSNNIGALQFIQKQSLLLLVGDFSGQAALLQTRKDETLLIWRNSFLVLNLGLDVVDGVAWFDFECDGFSCESFYEDLHFLLVVFFLLLENYSP